MTRSGGRTGAPEAVAELFATSAHDAVVRVLRDSGRALAKAEILDRLAAVGVSRSTADQAWTRAQKRLRHDHRVVAEKDRQVVRYRWNPDAAEPGVPDQPAAEELVPVSRLRQAELDAARELVGMAIDVEEQAAKGASAKAIIHRVRARMRRLRLEPVERAGETVPFDRARHEPIRSGVSDGAPVLVVRPGYIWRLPGDDLVVERPLVQD